MPLLRICTSPGALGKERGRGQYLGKSIHIYLFESNNYSLWDHKLVGYIRNCKSELPPSEIFTYGLYIIKAYVEWK